MNPPNKNEMATALPHPDLVAGLAARLLHCADKLHGKRALAMAADISEAQLFRYLNLESDVPTAKLVRVARAAGVDAGWLLTGDGPVDGQRDQRPPFKPELLQKLSQTLDEVLVEYPQRLSLRLKARYLPIIYDAVRSEELRVGADWQGGRSHMVGWLDYLTAIKDDEGLALYETLVQRTASGQPLALTAFMADELSHLIQRGITHRYDGPSGEVDFRQLTQTVVQDTARLRLSGMVEAVYRLTKTGLPPALLDLGCGNGRDLAFIHQLNPELRLAGLDASEQAVRLCQRLEHTRKLPADCVQLGDVTSLPFADASFSVAQMRLVLPFLAHFEGFETSAVQAIREAARVLGPGGMLYLDVFVGTARVLVPYVQLYNSASLTQLVVPLGFEMLEWTERHVQTLTGNTPSQYNQMESYYKTAARVTLRRR